MPGWIAKQLQLEGHNFKTTAIRFDDKRAGLCYHGDTIWKNDAGWEDFIDLDWHKVWEKGQICDYNDLPEDMKVECPGCGNARKKGDTECPKCGIIYSRYKSGTGEGPSEKKSRPAEPEPPKKSGVLRYAVPAIVLLIVALVAIGYYGKIKTEKESPSTTIEKPVEAPIKQNNVQHSAPTVNNTNNRYESPEAVQQDIFPDASFEDNLNNQTEEKAEEKYDFGNIEMSYKTIAQDLDNQHKALMAEQKRIVEEQKQARTSEDTIKVNERIIRLNDKIDAYEKKRAAFNAEVEAYNKRLGK